MVASKIAITIDDKILKQMDILVKTKHFPNRSKAIQEAVCEKLVRLVALEPTEPKLPRQSWVKISQIRTLSVNRIGKKLANATDEELAIIIDGLNEIIGG